MLSELSVDVADGRILMMVSEGFRARVDRKTCGHRDGAKAKSNTEDGLVDARRIDLVGKEGSKSVL